MKNPILFAILSLSAVLAAAEIPLPEHPRPDWERAGWINLNGPWRFRFDKKDEGVSAKPAWYAAEDATFDKTIVVPFGWGAPLSGVGDDASVGWYRRDVTVPAAWKGKRVFLVLGASDRETTCWLGSARTGTYLDGYTPAEFELTPYVKWGEPQKLTLCVNDKSADWMLYGKQGYGNARGIWQTAYLEARGEAYLESVHFTPDLENGAVTASVVLDGPAKKPLVFTVDFNKDDRAQPAVLEFAPGQMDAKLKIKLRNVKLWDLENPYLYEVSVTLADKARGVPEDVVKTYFGMRQISVTKLPGSDIPYVSLNGKPVYLQLTLDQSYHPTGFYTFPSDAFMKNEILISKKLGLNGNRVHIKAEIPRKLYWADKLGLLIMADVPCGWGDASPEMFRAHEACFRAMLKRDFNHPSVFSWVLFNETWGLFTRVPSSKTNAPPRKVYTEDTQRRVAAVWRTAKQLDPTRLVEDNSPCNRDHVVTDLNTWHAYTTGFNWERTVSNACVNTFAGSRHNFTSGHVQGTQPMLNSECGNVWGYQGSTGDCDFTWDYHLMIDAFRRHLKCSGWLYTEHHDVTNEWNGYVRFDRTPKFTGIPELFPGMSLASFHADAYLPLSRELCRDFPGGETYAVPVDVSLTTDRYAGRALALGGELRWMNAEGELKTRPLGNELATFTAKSWQNDHLADVPVKLPDETACGTVCFFLKDGEDVVARNFTCFTTKGAAAPRTVSVPAADYASAAWSLKHWNVLGGLKACGTGKGAFTYAFKLPDEARTAARVTFRAELGTKRLYAKDAAEKNGKATEDLGYMLGGGKKDRAWNPNAYPQTSTDTWPGEVKIFANGVLVATRKLPDDPADHRGILSWAAQTRVSETLKKKNQLRDAGSYGYLVKADIPAEALARCKDGVLEIRLEETEGRGLAVYGAAFGRIPCDPSVSWQ